MRKLTSILLCALLLLSLTVPALAEEAKHMTVSDVKELLSLAENCRLDSYSVGLTVSLEADLDLTGMVFSEIPSFSGTFLGNGHTISGLSITVSGSDQGFFRYLTQTAQVRDLHLSGTVAPQGSRANAGGIAGVNAGTIQNCSFTGTLSGGENAGAIAGTNTVSGVIENCRVQGTVHGSHFIGGIAGTNSGIIRECENAAAVNTTPQQNTVDLSQITLGTITNTESVGTSTDIGGIAGASSGTIRSCKNTGNVGYPHMGYNIGGIAGSQTGYLIDCENYGTVSGRKEIGGIVGHLEPSILLRYDKDTLQILQSQLSALDSLTDRAVQNAGTNAENLRSLLLLLENHTSDARNAVELLLKEPGTQDPDAYLSALQTLSACLTGMVQAQQQLQQAVKDTGTDLSRDLQAIARQANTISATLGNSEEDLGATVQDVSDADTEDDLTGKVEASVNYGPVSGDLNVGGIAGAMALENDLDPEADVNITGQFSLNAAGKVRCVVLGCTNLGSVTAKKDRAGGIVGWQSMGLVKDCTNSGTVESADYAGGIAGQSYGYIRACYVKASVLADTYAGGIAGTGTVVTDCRSMAKLSAAEWLGGILGLIEENHTNTALPITGNLYLPIGTDPGAIDGISYDTKAQPLELESFMALEGLPELFTTVSVTFLFEDGTSQVISLDPGGTLDPKDIPQVPEKPGYVGRWEDLNEADMENVRFDVTFRITYAAHGATVASTETRDGKPLLLLQGDFTPDAAIAIDADVSPDWEKDLLESLGFAVSDGAQPTRGRYLLPEIANPQQLHLYILTASGEWKEAPYTIEGSYIVFDLDSGDNGIALIQGHSRTLLWIVIGVFALVVLTVVTVLIVIHKRKAKKSPDPDREQATL